MAEIRSVQTARTQRGVITLRQLLDAGFTPDQITRRVRTGWLVRLHEGVYAIGAIGAIGRTQAALLACGPGSIADAGTAAALHDLLPYPAIPHVVVRRNGPRPKAVRTRHPRVLPDWTRRHGLRTTTVPETLLAIAATDSAAAREATDQAFIHRRTHASALTCFLDDKRGHRGVRTLREILHGPRTRSDAERRFWKLLHDANLPLPLTNVRVNGHLVDFYWPDHNLIVETDGWASHGRREQWERDHRRGLDHFAAGVTVLRISARQLADEPFAVVAALARRLA